MTSSEFPPSKEDLTAGLHAIRGLVQFVRRGEPICDAAENAEVSSMYNYYNDEADGALSILPVGESIGKIRYGTVTFESLSGLQYNVSVLNESYALMNSYDTGAPMIASAYIEPPSYITTNFWMQYQFFANGRMHIHGELSPNGTRAEIQSKIALLERLRLHGPAQTIERGEAYSLSAVGGMHLDPARQVGPFLSLLHELAN